MEHWQPMIGPNYAKEWEHYTSAEDLTQWTACFETAESEGHSRAEAEMCDNGSVGCAKCPFLRMYTTPTH